MAIQNGRREEDVLMVMTSSRPPISPGERAPDFRLPAINQDGALSLTDYRGRPVLLAMMRGLYCAFCRRHIAQLGATRQKLQPLGSRCWRSSE
jgi:peroxiredoxin